MALLSDKLKTCGVKIKTMVGGVPSFGSGVVYVTPNEYDYNYIITAKHLFQEDPDTEFEYGKVYNIDIQYSEKGKFKRLDYIKRSEISSKLIPFDNDFAIIIINKNRSLNFRQIIVSDVFEDEDLDFFSWATFTANQDELQHFVLKRSDIELMRFHVAGNLKHQFLPGISGAGVFHHSKSILCGTIIKCANDEFQNETVDCALIQFSEVNNILKQKNLVELDTHSSKYKREINNEVVYIHEALINEVSLDLELARKRLKTDISDDWYHDPLKYIDLLQPDYIFKQFEPYFGNLDYTTQEAERFYVPKKQFTLRQALVSPFVDRIVYLALVGCLAERLDDAMIPNVYSARYNRYSDNQLILNGVEQWKKMQYKLAEVAFKKDTEDKYTFDCVVEIDLLNFYDNINKNLLGDKVKRICKTENEVNAASLLHNFIARISKKELGLPQNSDASSLLASFYLNQVDIFMVHHCPHYYRFMDDIRIFCRDKYEARRILQIFEFELRRCHLSVNSQKTKIKTFVETPPVHPDEIQRTEYKYKFDLELNKISRLKKSENRVYLNDAFHLSVNVLEQALASEDLNSSEDSARKLNYALNTICILGQKSINLYTEDSRFEKAILHAVKGLKDKPWITTQICRVLNLISTPSIKDEYFEYLKEIVLDSSYNTYAFQTYQLWLVLAKHKIKSDDLSHYAISQIEKNDETNRPVIAAMVIYLCSIDLGYRRVILRKLGENFTHGYFQNRIAMISLRSFDISMIDFTHVDKTLKEAHLFTHRYKDKDLVFVQGFDEEDEQNEMELEQLYSV